MIPTLVVPTGHADNMTALAVSSDNRYFATGAHDLTVKLWDLEGRLIRTFRDKDADQVDSICFSHDTTALAVAYSNNHLVCFDLRSGEPRFRLGPKALDKAAGQKDFSLFDSQLFFAPDNSFLLTAGKTAAFRLDPEDGKSLSPALDFQNDNVLISGLSPDGKALCSLLKWGKAVLRGIPNGEKKWEIDTGISNAGSVSFSPDNKRLLIAGQNENSQPVIRLIESDSGKIRTLSQNEVSSEYNLRAAFSENGSRVVAAFGYEKKLLSWKTEDLSEKPEIHALEPGFYHAVFSADGSRFLTSNHDGIDYTARIRRTSDGATLRILEGRSHLIHSARLTSGGKKLFVSTAKVGQVAEPAIRRLDLDNDLPATAFKASGYSAVMAVSPDGKLCVYDNGKSGLTIRNMTDGSETEIDAGFGMADPDLLARNPGWRDQIFRNLAISPDGKWLAAALFGNPVEPDKLVLLYDLEKEKLYPPVHWEGSGAVESVRFSHDSKQLLARDQKGNVRIWETGEGETKPRKFFHEYAGDADFSPDSPASMILSGSSSEGMAILHDMETLKPLRKMGFGPEDRHQRRIRKVAFADGLSRVITGHYRWGFAVWDGDSGDPVSSFREHIIGLEGLFEHSVCNIPGSGPAKVLTSAGDDNVCLWEVETGKLLATLYFLDDNDWAVSTPSGLFDASPGAMELLHYTAGLEVIQLDQMKERYYFPGLLPILMGLEEGNLPDTGEFQVVELFPEITEAVIQDNKLHLKIRPRNGGIGQISLFIDGKEVIEDIDPTRSKVALTVDLSPFAEYLTAGKNMLAVRTWNADGWLKSQAKVMEFSAPAPALPDKKEDSDTELNLYGIFIGTSRYQGTVRSLRYPDQDAEYLSEAVRLAGGGLFGKDKLNIQLLTSGMPGTPPSSKTNIQKAFETVAGLAKPEDVLIVYFSGHGANHSDGNQAQFYYLTMATRSPILDDPAVREQVGISSDEITGWLKRIRAKKQLMIFDTCHSGKFLEAIESKNLLEATKVRALERMKDRTGTWVIAGSAGDKVSYEATQYGQGLLTYSLLEGMKGIALRRTERNEIDPKVDVITLLQWSRDRVPQLAGNLTISQIPVMKIPTHGESFDIGISDEAIQRRIRLAQPKDIFVRSMLMDSDSYFDHLDLSRLTDEQFIYSSILQHDVDAVFFDLDKFPGAYSVRGLYSVQRDGSGKVIRCEVKGKLYKDGKSVGDFTVDGRDASDTAPRIAQEIHALTYPYEDEDTFYPAGPVPGLTWTRSAEDELKGVEGYKADFLGKGFEVPLPALPAAMKAKTAKMKGTQDSVIPYQYYSVVQHKERKFPIFAACNYHGGYFVQAGRHGDFEKDHRLDPEDQWGKDLYNSLNKEIRSFIKAGHPKLGWDRGHMTKREDTQWAPGKPTDPAVKELAEKGARLTFFYTNSVPQLNRLNQLCWRGLENYIIVAATPKKRAKRDTDKEAHCVNILTGPVLDDNDPEFEISRKDPDTKKMKKEKVRIPVMFWKVIYYKKPDGKLYMAGFVIGQEKLLRERGVISKTLTPTKDMLAGRTFKDKEVYQVKVSFIESVTGLKFHKAIDPCTDDRGREVIYKYAQAKKLEAGEDLPYEMEGLAL